MSDPGPEDYFTRINQSNTLLAEQIQIINQTKQYFDEQITKVDDNSISDLITTCKQYAVHNCGSTADVIHEIGLDLSCLLEYQSSRVHNLQFRIHSIQTKLTTFEDKLAVDYSRDILYLRVHVPRRLKFQAIPPDQVASQGIKSGQRYDHAPLNLDQLDTRVDDEPNWDIEVVPRRQHSYSVAPVLAASNTIIGNSNNWKSGMASPTSGSPSSPSTPKDFVFAAGASGHAGLGALTEGDEEDEEEDHTSRSRLPNTPFSNTPTPVLAPITTSFSPPPPAAPPTAMYSPPPPAAPEPAPFTPPPPVQTSWSPPPPAEPPVAQVSPVAPVFPPSPPTPHHDDSYLPPPPENTTTFDAFSYAPPAPPEEDPATFDVFSAPAPPPPDEGDQYDQYDAFSSPAPPPPEPDAYGNTNAYDASQYTDTTTTTAVDAATADTTTGGSEVQGQYDEHGNWWYVGADGQWVMWQG